MKDVEEPASKSTRLRLILRWLVAALYLAAGVGHLVVPDKLLLITPDWVPFARQVILVTGVLEIAGAVALFVPALRATAGIGLAAYAVCVWPANVKHALDGIDLPFIASSWFYHGPRLALQPVIIWASLYAGGVVDWPFGQRRRRDGDAAGARFPAPGD